MPRTQAAGAAPEASRGRGPPDCVTQKNESRGCGDIARPVRSSPAASLSSELSPARANAFRLPAGDQLIGVVEFLRAAKVVPQDVLADVAALTGPRLLVEAKVNPAVDASIVDVVGDLVPCSVTEDDTGLSGMRQRDGMAVLTEGTLHHRAAGARHCRVAGPIAWEC